MNMAQQPSIEKQNQTITGNNIPAANVFIFSLLLCKQKFHKHEFEFCCLFFQAKKLSDEEKEGESESEFRTSFFFANHRERNTRSTGFLP